MTIESLCDPDVENSAKFTNRQVATGGAPARGGAAIGPLRRGWAAARHALVTACCPGGGVDGIGFGNFVTMVRLVEEGMPLPPPPHAP